MVGESKDGDRLAPSHVFFPDPQVGPWLVVLEWQSVAGRAECVGIHVTSSEKFRGTNEGRGGVLPDIGTPLTTAVLRGIRLSELVADHRGGFSYLYGELAGNQELSAPYREPKSMRPATERRLRRVADTYQAAWKEGQPPTRAVARREGISDAAAAKLVARARAARMLPQTSPGIAAGGRRPVGE